MKKKLLIIGIAMFRAGTEKAFLSMANAINYDEYDVDLLLAKKEGELLGDIPPAVNVIEMEKYGDWFLLSSKNAYRVVWNEFIKADPRRAFRIFPYFVSMLVDKKHRQFTAAKMWVELMKRYMPVFDNGVDYDAAIAYWGDRTMFYMIDKVPRAKKKLTWLHFDYGNPKRDDSLYLPYFKACDRIVTVSEAVDSALKSALPEISDKCAAMENIIDSARIRTLALTGETFPDRHFKGLRILSVMRISEQKGVDFIAPVLKKLRDDGRDVRWYIVGDGDEAAKNALIEQSIKEGVADILLLLGSKENPYAFMRDADIFVLPSRYEGRPITVEEAKILMKPIVCTNYVSASEQLMGGEYGVICEAGTDGIYKAVKGLLDSEETRDRFTVVLSKHDFGNLGGMETFYDMLKM